MSRKSIQLDVLKDVVADVNPLFTTMDVSEDKRVRDAHPELADHRNYHAFVGGALSDHRVALGIAEVQKSTPRGSQWQKEACQATKEDDIRGLVRAGLTRLIKETDIMWPGMDRQLPERNLSLYAAHEFLSQGYTAMTEWPFNRNEHIDLVAYHPAAKTLVLIESKRAWSRSLELSWLCGDVQRLERAAQGLDAWTLTAANEWERIQPQTVIGVVLVGSTDETSLNPDRLRRGQVNDVVRALINKVGRFDHVAHRDKQYPYVLHYAAWRIPCLDGTAFASEVLS